MAELDGKPDASELYARLVEIRDSLTGEEQDEDGNPGLDVRLQVVDGSWAVHTGSAQYDTDHRGYWGYGTIDSETDLLALASSMLDEVDEDYHTDRPDDESDDDEDDVRPVW